MNSHPFGSGRTKAPKPGWVQYNVLVPPPSRDEPLWGLLDFAARTWMASWRGIMLNDGVPARDLPRKLGDELTVAAREPDFPTPGVFFVTVKEWMDPRKPPSTAPQSIAEGHRVLADRLLGRPRHAAAFLRVCRPDLFDSAVRAVRIVRGGRTVPTAPAPTPPPAPAPSLTPGERALVHALAKGPVLTAVLKKTLKTSEQEVRNRVRSIRQKAGKRVIATTPDGYVLDQSGSPLF